MKAIEKLKAGLKTCPKESLAVTAMLFVVILVGCVYLLVAPKQAFSEDENRALEATPKASLEKLADGSFMKSVESYVGDHFLLRKEFVELNTISQLALGKRDLGGNYASTPAEGGVYFGKNGHLYEVLLPNRTDTFVKNASALGRLGELTGLQTYLLPVPSGSQEQPGNLPTFAPNHDQREELAALQRVIGENTTVVDVFDALGEKNGDYYFKTDHHWNLQGAYVGYTALMNAMDMEATPIEQYQFELVSDRFLGTLYSKAICPWQEADQFYLPRFLGTEQVTQESPGEESRDSLYWTEYLEKKDKYSTFLGGNHSVDVVRNASVTNGKRLLILKDSFANSMVPFMTSNFEEIHIIDLRYYKKDVYEYIKQNEISEIAAVYSIKQLCDVSISNRLIPR